MSLRFRARLWVLLFSLCLAFAGVCFADSPEAESASQITIRVRSEHGSSLDRLTDDNYRTCVPLLQERSVTVTSEEPFSRLYIRFDDIPPVWELRAEDTVLTCGTNGFLHEFVSLPLEVCSVTFTFSGTEGVRLADIFAFSDGPLPSWVQQWSPPCEKADLLLFPAHSDDEFLFFGGIIPYYAGQLGLRVQVAYMVDHRLTEPYRSHEMLDSLWAAGDIYYPVMNVTRDFTPINLLDAQLLYGVETITAYQVEMIRRFQPMVVVGHDVDGEYGHAAHQLYSLCLQDAVFLSSEPSQYPDSVAAYGTWDPPKTYLHLFGEDPTILNFEEPLDAFDGRTALDMAAEAYACCLSQVAQGYFDVYSFDSPYDCHRFGLYRSLVGEDTDKNDLLEHLSLD